MNLNNFDVFNCALNGSTLVEASAGTGKTWNICIIYLRLIIETRLTPEQILVVTFTKSAANELRERIYYCINTLVNIIERGKFSIKKTDNILLRLLDSKKIVNIRHILTKLRYAQNSFNKFAIHTIHAFCQRILNGISFSTSIVSSKLEIIESDINLRLHLAATFWTEYIEPKVSELPVFAVWLIDNKINLYSLDEHLKKIIKNPASYEVFLQKNSFFDVKILFNHERTNLFKELSLIWNKHKTCIIETLEQNLPNLRLNIYKKNNIASALNNWSTFLNSNDSLKLNCNLESMSMLSLAKLRASLKKGHLLFEHVFFHLAEKLLLLIKCEENNCKELWLHLLQLWLKKTPKKLEFLKEQKNCLVINDLVLKLFNMLNSHSWLSAKIANNFPAILIDEFQDTDLIQFKIFHTIYKNNIPNQSLFLVGDPKQAIYSFRLANLNTYFYACSTVDAKYTLNINYRSTKSIVETLNYFFTLNENAFILPNLKLDLSKAHQQESLSVFIDDNNIYLKPMQILCLSSYKTYNFIDKKNIDSFNINDIRNLVVQVCADEIVRLLEYGYINKKKVIGSDIIILVRTHQQAVLFKEILVERGVNSTEFTPDSIFASQDALEVENILRAVNNPNNIKYINLALTSDWFSLDINILHSIFNILKDKEYFIQFKNINRKIKNFTSTKKISSAIYWIECFYYYHFLYLEKGFLVMWKHLIQELHILQTISHLPNAERRLTNINHLSELLYEFVTQTDNLHYIIDWISNKRCIANTTLQPTDIKNIRENEYLRLESDSNLVKIITIHKSKGLEYPIVFCPFMYESYYNYKQNNSFSHSHYIQKADHNQSTNKELNKIQTYAEEVRLLYVALTRAINCIYLVVSTIKEKNIYNNVLNWIISGKNQTFDTWENNLPNLDEINTYWYSLCNEYINVLPILEPKFYYFRNKLPKTLLLTRTLKRNIIINWQLISFTKLISNNIFCKKIKNYPKKIFINKQIKFLLNNKHHYDCFSKAISHIINSNSQINSNASFCRKIKNLGKNNLYEKTYLSTLKDENKLNIYNNFSKNFNHKILLSLPQGKITGLCIHNILATVNFSQPDQWYKLIINSINLFPFFKNEGKTLPNINYEDINIIVYYLMYIVNVVSKIKLLHNLPDLSLLPSTQYIREMCFTFLVKSSSTFSSKKLYSIISSYGYKIPSLINTFINGYIKGSIDLIFKKDKQFYIVDWKLHHLGDNIQEYLPKSIKNVVINNGYLLQAILYTVALHRYLRTIINNYDYNIHIGGIIYVFIRSMSPIWININSEIGIFRHRFEHDLIETIDKNFSS